MNKYFLYLKILSPNVKKNVPSGFLGRSQRAIQAGGDAQPEKQPRFSLPW